GFSGSGPLRAPVLLGLEPAILLPPAVVGHLGHADRAHRIGHALPLRDQDIHLAQLGDDLLGLVPLAWHRGPPSCPKTYLRMDHFSGGGSVADFEFHAPAGERPLPLCFVTLELFTGEIHRYWQDDLATMP